MRAAPLNSRNNANRRSLKTDIVAISAGCNTSVGLKSDGTVVAVGEQSDGACDVSGWKLS